MNDSVLTVVGGTEDRGSSGELHEPTDLSRQRVFLMARYGVTQRAIAVDIGVSVNTLRKHYMVELLKGDSEAQQAIGKSTMIAAFGHAAQYDAEGRLTKAEKPPNAMLLMFLCKTRLGWRDGGPGQIDRGEVPADDGIEYNTAGLNERERVERVAGILDAARARRAGRPADGASSLGAVSGKSAANGSGERG
jgi:hypothetical protein